MTQEQDQNKDAAMSEQQDKQDTPTTGHEYDVVPNVTLERVIKQTSLQAATACVEAFNGLISFFGIVLLLRSIEEQPSIVLTNDVTVSVCVCVAVRVCRHNNKSTTDVIVCAIVYLLLVIDVTIYASV